MNKILKAIESFVSRCWSPPQMTPVSDFGRFLVMLACVAIAAYEFVFSESMFRRAEFLILGFACVRWASVTFVNCLRGILDELYDDLTSDEVEYSIEIDQSMSGVHSMGDFIVDEAEVETKMTGYVPDSQFPDSQFPDSLQPMIAK